MKMYIPALGDVIILRRSWSFTLYKERRNQLKVEWGNKQSIKVTLRSGTLLKVERIYIRSGAGKFSSLTFRIPNEASSRFWAKLEDVNGMEFERCESANMVSARLDAEWAKTHPQGLWAVHLSERKWDDSQYEVITTAPFFFCACYTPVRPSENNRSAARIIYAGNDVRNYVYANQFKPGAAGKWSRIYTFDTAAKAKTFLAQYVSQDEASNIMAKLAS